MKLTTPFAIAALSAGLGLTGLFGAATAGADPGPDCGRPGVCQHDGPGGPGQGPQGRGQGPAQGPAQGPGGAPVDWNHRGIDQGRSDHQPFNWNGQQVTPMPAGNGAGWGFWFLGTWIPL